MDTQQTSRTLIPRSVKGVFRKMVFSTKDAFANEGGGEIDKLHVFHGKGRLYLSGEYRVGERLNLRVLRCADLFDNSGSIRGFLYSSPTFE